MLSNRHLLPVSLVTGPEIISVISVSRSKFHRMVSEGRFPPPLVRSHRMTRWQWADVLAYLENPAAWENKQPSKEVDYAD